MKKIILKNIYIVASFLIALTFIIIFGKPAILKSYVELGIGGCKTIPILCIVPEEELVNPAIDKAYLADLMLYKLPEIQINLPKGFSVFKGKFNKVYYKKRYNPSESIVYLLYEKPNFFVNIFPQLNKQGIRDDESFLNRTMSVNLNNIRDVTDTFFVIMKSIFTPDLGDQKNLKMVKFTMQDKKGFINYNYSLLENYFDCNVINNNGDFFKIYIRDKDKLLDLDRVLAIISTLKKIN